MSLINQMLKDLENRTRISPMPEVVLSGLQSISETDRRGKMTWAVFGMVLILFITIFIMRHQIFNYKNTQPVELPSQILMRPATQSPSPIDIAVPSINSPPAILTGITLQTQEDMTYLRFLLSKNSFYTLSTDLTHRQLIIVLEHARLTTSLPPINYFNTAIQNITMENESDGNLKIILMLTHQADLQRLELNETGKLPELQLDIYNNKNLMANDVEKNPIITQKAAIVENRVGIIKKIVVDTSVQEKYERALAFSAIGQANKTILLLTNLVKEFPAFYPARQSLVGFLLQKGDRVQANRLLQPGLQQQPDYIPFLELKARLLFEDGKTDQALNTLEQASPSLEKNPDYYAFIAALYQQKGQGGMAAKLYERLLISHPNKGVWWMGLGIALDSIGKHAEAVEAFRRADNSDGLTPELRAYVENQRMDG